MKKQYTTPEIQVIKIDMAQVICQSVQNDAGLNPIIQPGNGEGRAACSRDWLEWEAGN